MMFKSKGVCVPDFLLPRDGISHEAWAVIACDQFTQDRSYWDAVEAFVGDNPSALRIVLPEIDLADTDLRVPQIQQTMRMYRDEVLTKRVHGFALVRRETETMTRRGLLATIDLEKYDYSEGSTSMIRPTEGTIVARLPPRVKVRLGACIESPHVLVLLDDPECTVVEPLFERTDSLETLYDFDLMMGGGHIRGWAVSAEEDLEAIDRALSAIASDEIQRARYGDAYTGDPLLFAVGDGNHSLATARACWENIKATLSETERETHPARFAMVEIGNLHDPGLVFEPIHRVLFGVDPTDALKSLAQYLEDHKGEGGHQKLRAFHGKSEVSVHTATAPHRLPVGSLQGWIDAYLAEHPGVEVDYIHGDAEAVALAKGAEALAFLLEGMDKNELFASVLQEGALPRKTFSIGEARDKRYYLECRAIEPEARENGQGEQ